MRGAWLLGLVMCLAVASGCNVGTGWSGRYESKGDPYDRITNGMTERQVVDLMGMPSKRSRVEGEGGDGTYVIQMRYLTPNHIIIIFMVDGVVAGKSRV